MTHHQWDEDGSTCVKCGDKDWMADPLCSESKLNLISDDELKSMLTKIAVNDLAETAEIYDHPCSIAIRRIEFLKAVISANTDSNAKACDA